MVLTLGGGMLLRWAGWEPSGQDDPQLRCLLLLGRTQAQLAPHFPASAVAPADVADASAAAGLFMRLLAAAHSTEQLLALRHILQHVWAHGNSFSAHVQVDTTLQDS
jgi:hypothetical protein